LNRFSSKISSVVDTVTHINYLDRSIIDMKWRSHVDDDWTLLDMTTKHGVNTQTISNWAEQSIEYSPHTIYDTIMTCACMVSSTLYIQVLLRTCNKLHCGSVDDGSLLNKYTINGRYTTVNSRRVKVHQDCINVFFFPISQTEILHPVGRQFHLLKTWLWWT
jgi:hypothetical protein